MKVERHDTNIPSHRPRHAGPLEDRLVHAPRRHADFPVGVMGLGVLGTRLVANLRVARKPRRVLVVAVVVRAANLFTKCLVANELAFCFGAFTQRYE